MPAVQLHEYNDTATTARGAWARLLVQRLVADVPFLSVESVEQDTDAAYEATLAVSFDSTTKLKILPQSGNPNTEVARVMFNDAAASTSAALWFNNSAANTNNTYIFVGDNFCYFAVGQNGNAPGDSNGMLLGQVANYYDNNKATVACAYATFQSANANQVKVNTGGTTQSVGRVNAFVTPYTKWGGTGHLYAAVPIAFSNSVASMPIRAFMGGTDSIYQLFDNGSQLNAQPFTRFTINGHEFFYLRGNSGNTAFGGHAFRLS